MEKFADLRTGATELRKQGKSYREIVNLLGIPKSTLSSWFSESEWSKNTRNDLNQRRLDNARLNLVAANKARALKVSELRDRYIEDARHEFEQLKNNPLFILGLGLYWGEGDKVENGRVAVINTDSNLLKIIAAFYRKCLKIPDGKLRAGLFIYDDIDPDEALNYWSKVLNLPRSQFIKTQNLKSRSKLTNRKLRYGVCSLYFSSSELSIKIHEWTKLAAIVQW